MCWVHIRHLCLTGIWVSLLQRVTLQKRQSNQSAFAPSYGLRCAQVPSLRSCSVGPPPRAIHGPSRLSRHPCRSTHCAEPPLGLPGGQADQKHCTTRRPTGRPFGASVCYTISVAAAEERRLRSATKSSHKPGKALCLIHQVFRVCPNCCVTGAI